MAGAAIENLLDFVLPDRFYVRPGDFRWLMPKLLVQVGDRVNVGAPLFCDKRDERVLFVSPVTGTVRDIVRGEKRVIEAVVIDRDPDAQTEVAVEFEMPADGDTVRKQLLQYGLWPCHHHRLRRNS